MKKFYLAVLILCIVIAGALSADAYMGNNSSHQSGQNMTYNHNQMYNKIDQKTIDAMQNERTAFFNKTNDLTNNIYRKSLEIQSEYAAKNPDTDKIKSLQKEISDLQADLAQKRVEHELKMKKINPNYRGGMMMGNGRMMNHEDMVNANGMMMNHGGMMK